MIAPCSCAQAASFSTRVDRAERVRDEVVRDDLHVAAAPRSRRARPAAARRCRRSGCAELRAGPLRDELPRHEVRVVLELGDHDDVAGAEVGEPVGVGDQVQGLGGVAHEDDLAVRRGVDEGAHLLAGALEARGRALAERVDAAVDVRVRVLVELAHRVEHLARLLGRRGRVEVGDAASRWSAARRRRSRRAASARRALGWSRPPGKSSEAGLRGDPAPAVRQRIAARYRWPERL